MKEFIKEKLFSDVHKQIRSLRSVNDGLVESAAAFSDRLDRLERENKRLKNELKKSYVNNRLVDFTVDSVWFYTMMKSGTTYTINVILNYISLLSDESSSPVRNELLECFHSTHNKVDNPKIGSVLSEQEAFLKGVGFKYFVHTHRKIASLSKRTIVLSRNPLDFIVSKYFYMYKNRGVEVSLEDKTGALIKEYMKYYRGLRAVVSGGNNFLELRYEDLMLDPEGQFKKVIEYLDIEYDERLLRVAVEYSSKDSVRKMEADTGGAIIASKNKFTGKSFIRSGKVGDWKQYISSARAEELLQELEGEGFDRALYKYE